MTVILLLLEVEAGSSSQTWGWEASALCQLSSHCLASCSALGREEEVVEVLAEGQVLAA